MKTPICLHRALPWLGLGLGLGLLLGQVPSAWALTAEQVYARVAPSVWRVVTYDVDNLPLGQGSGVVVGPQSVVTNCHVLAKAKRVSVRREKESLDAKLELWDVKRDVCQLAVPALRAPVVTVADSGKVAVGQSVFALGNPRGLDLTMSAGLVSQLRKNNAGQLVLIQTSAAISGGSSGGGLFDDQGALVGLTTLGSVGDAQNLNFAIPSEWIRDLPQRHAQAAAPAAHLASTGAAWARLDDVTRLPYASDRMRERYRIFLTLPMPRAFVISEGGDWYPASGAVAQGQLATGTPTERALRDCEKTGSGRCHLYAIDEQVVYRLDPAAR